MTKVIVPQRAGHSFDKATEYGEVVELLPGRVSPFNIDMLKRRIRKRLDDIRVTADDYLATSGPAIVNCLVFYEWNQRFGKVELLLFHARDLKYIHRTCVPNDNEKSPRNPRRNRKTNK